MILHWWWNGFSKRLWYCCIYLLCWLVFLSIVLNFFLQFKKVISDSIYAPLEVWWSMLIYLLNFSCWWLHYFIEKHWQFTALTRLTKWQDEVQKATRSWGTRNFIAFIESRNFRVLKELMHVKFVEFVVKFACQHNLLVKPSDLYSLKL